MSVVPRYPPLWPGADVGPGYFWHSGVMAIGGDPVAAAKGDRALGWHYN